MSGPDVLDGARIVVDRERCMGSGSCIVYAPDTFEHDDDAIVVVVAQPGDPLEAVRVAVSACPVGALSIIEREVQPVLPQIDPATPPGAVAP